MTLTEFLLARIAEDEAVARETAGTGFDLGTRLSPAEVDGHVSGIHIDPARVLAECEAKRQVVELHSENSTIPGRDVLPCWVCTDDYPCQTLRLLAAPYSGHSDFHPGWKG